MELRLVSLEKVPDHPKFLKLPSVSRSLRHNILPQTTHQMHKNPALVILKEKLSFINNAPQFTNRKRSRSKKREPELIYNSLVQPKMPPYTYSKMYWHKKSESINITRHRSISAASSTKRRDPKLQTFCLVNTIIHDTGGQHALQRADSKAGLLKGKEKGRAVNQEVIDSLVPDSGNENLVQIEEVHSGLELSDEEKASVHGLRRASAPNSRRQKEIEQRLIDGRASISIQTYLPLTPNFS